MFAIQTFFAALPRQYCAFDLYKTFLRLLFLSVDLSLCLPPHKLRCVDSAAIRNTTEMLIFLYLLVAFGYYGGN